MIIGGLQKTTLLDFPNHVACIIFTKGCNFRCPFCQNSTLIGIDHEDEISEEYIFDYLIKRQGILDGVVITGGEPTVQKDLKEFIKKIRKLGYKVKLDTNGYNPNVLKELIDENLLDYVAMDIKHTFEKYHIVAGKILNTDNILESIKRLEESDVCHEFRTTIIKEYHTIDDIIEITSYFKSDTPYYLQNFKNSSNVLDKSLHGFTNEELEEINTHVLENRKIKIR
ncbi:MAG: anaerobic ribonucleoside-triphosphate reductase activating protein [bacterium]|nr:anaerobic ribonucleoside-triphosphate reductase activating protein [bacterium]